MSVDYFEEGQTMNPKRVKKVHQHLFLIHFQEI
jgi:hypothetical protein